MALLTGNGNESDINEVNIREGINFILSHFNEPLFPRRIFTPIEKQVIVNSDEEIVEKFKKCGFKDSRISAYPYYGEKHFEYLGLDKPDLLFIDLDKCHFKTVSALKANLHKTLKNIRTKLCCHNAAPTVLESGSGGYHIIQPLAAINLKKIDFFTKWSKEPNRDFLRFLEPFLCSKSDPNHYRSVSMNNCLLRVPGSINSKNDVRVKIVRMWNGVRPDIKFVYGDFLGYLVDKRNEAASKFNFRTNFKSCAYGRYENKSWMEYCKGKGNQPK